MLLLLLYTSFYFFDLSISFCTFIAERERYCDTTRHDNCQSIVDTSDMSIRLNAL